MKYNTKDVTEPKSGSIVRRGSYWICEDGQEQKALFFGDSPQCNKDVRIAEWVLKHSWKNQENLKVVYIDIAYIPNIQ